MHSSRYTTHFSFGFSDAFVWILRPAIPCFLWKWLENTNFRSFIWLQTSHVSLLLKYSQWYVPFSWLDGGWVGRTVAFCPLGGRSESLLSSPPPPSLPLPLPLPSGPLLLPMLAGGSGPSCPLDGAAFLDFGGWTVGLKISPRLYIYKKIGSDISK